MSSFLEDSEDLDLKTSFSINVYGHVTGAEAKNRQCLRGLLRVLRVYTPKGGGVPIKEVFSSRFRLAGYRLAALARRLLRGDSSRRSVGLDRPLRARRRGGSVFGFGFGRVAGSPISA
jgi:hypothetical protein